MTNNVYNCLISFNVVLCCLIFDTMYLKRIQGNGLVNFTLNTTGDWTPSLHLFLNEDYRDALEEPECNNKLDKARIIRNLNSKTGNFNVEPFHHPKLWHLVFADTNTCEDDDDDDDMVKTRQPNFIHYHIELLNPDALGNPKEHFGDDETGLLRFYQLLTLAYFVLGCIFAPRLYESLSHDGPMKLVIKLITVSTGCQALGGFIMIIHLQRYSKDGVGSPFVELLAELFDVLSQFAMLYMLLSLSFGWKLGTSFSHIQVIRKKPAARIVGVLGIIQAVLFIWEQIQDDDHRMYHAHRTYAGIALVLLRIMLAALFAWNLNVTVSSERSVLRREFYKSFTKSCMLWFLCYPLIVVMSWIFSEYLRYKLITMGVVLCQCCAVAMLYKLFLSRSLYWEISALSSALPLRIDRNFGLKVYS